MDVTPKKWSTQKIVAIALMALAFLMLNVSWIKIDSDALEAVDEMRDDLEEELEWIEEEYDDSAFVTITDVSEVIGNHIKNNKGLRKNIKKENEE